MASDRLAGLRSVPLRPALAPSHNRPMSAPAPLKVLLGVTGGIAADKSAELVRRLREQGVEVQVVMTEGAQHFVGAATFQALSGRPVRSNLWDPAAEAAMGHIELARWAHRIVVAPASADFLARLAHGLANDLLTTLCLATDAPISVRARRTACRAMPPIVTVAASISASPYGTRITRLRGTSTYSA